MPSTTSFTRGLALTLFDRRASKQVDARRDACLTLCSVLLLLSFLLLHVSSFADGAPTVPPLAVATETFALLPSPLSNKLQAEEPYVQMLLAEQDRHQRKLTNRLLAYATNARCSFSTRMLHSNSKADAFISHVCCCFEAMCGIQSHASRVPLFLLLPP
jgi:hypothetical protein